MQSGMHVHFDDIAERRYLSAWETNNLPDSPEETRSGTTKPYLFNLSIATPSRREEPNANPLPIPSLNSRRPTPDPSIPKHLQRRHTTPPSSKNLAPLRRR